MAYTDIDDPSAYFQTTLYTGNGGTLAVTNGGNSDLQPDWLWLKKRSASVNHFLFDSIRGASKEINSNNTEAEASPSNYLASFNSDGFSIGSDSDINGNNDTLVAWQWKAGTAFSNDASSTSVGSIDSAGSVNQDAGFSIISYTGTGSNATVAHGLGAAPRMIIFKRYGTSGNWGVYHESIGNTKSLSLNTTSATDTDASYWNNTSPTSSVFSLGSSSLGNASTNIIAYSFAEKKGYSKFGSYIGNGNSDGTFVYTGFKPAFFLGKRTNSSGEWFLLDNKRNNSFNPQDRILETNSNSADISGSSYKYDFLSNGIKIRTTSQAYGNGSGDTFLYMAFAEQPFVTSTGIPTTAR